MIFLWIDFILATTIVITLIICYALILAKLKPANDSSENLALPPTPQENNENIAQQRRKKMRMKMLEKIKEEKINAYYDRKKRKTRDS
jgi:hypothetical protein